MLIILVTLSILTLVLFFFNTFCLGDLWINLSAGFITLIFTIFIIDVLLENRRRQELKEADSVFMIEIWEMIRKMTVYILIPIDNEIKNKFIGLNEGKHKSTLKGIVQEMIGTQFIDDNLHKLSIQKWEHLEINLIDIRLSMDEVIKIYQPLLPIYLIGKIYGLRKKYIEFYNHFALFSQTFIHDPIKDDELKNIFINELSNKLQSYYEALFELIKSLEKYEKNDQ